MGKYLRSYEVWSACKFFLSIVHLASEAEIYELYCAFGLVEHDVLRLDVSVNNALAVHVVQRAQQLVHYFRAVLLVEIFLVVGTLFDQLTTRAQFHAEVDEAFILVRLEVVNDVGVVHLLNSLDLLMDVINLLFRQFALVDGLDRQLKVFILLVLSAVNHTEGTFSKQVLIDVICCP